MQVIFLDVSVYKLICNKQYMHTTSGVMAAIDKVRVIVVGDSGNLYGECFLHIKYIPFNNIYILSYIW